MCKCRLIALTFFTFSFVACPSATSCASDPIALRPMRDTLLQLTVEQSADIPAAGLATMLKAIMAADKDLTENDKRHLLVIRGNAELRVGNSDLAESLFDQALLIDDNDYLTTWLRGRCKEVTRRFDSAIEDCQKSLELKPDFPAAMLSIAAIYVEKNDLDEASNWLAKVESLDGHDDKRWEAFVRSVMALKQRKFSDAIDHAEQSLRGRDRFLFVPIDKILSVKAIAQFSAGQPSEAKETLRELLSLQPSNQQALQMMWTIHSQSGKHLAAYMYAKHLVKIDSGNLKYHSFELKSLLQLRQLAAAEKVAREILKIDPENGEAKTVLERLEAAKNRSKPKEKIPANGDNDNAPSKKPNTDEAPATDP